MTPTTPASPPPPHDKIDPIVWLLFGGIFAAVALMVLISKWSPNDGQTFQVLAGLATFFSGALGLRIKPAEPKQDTKPKTPEEK